MASEPQQHYPTYDFKDRDIVLAEYDAVSGVLGAEERMFTNSVNVTLLIAAGVGSLALGQLDTLYVAMRPHLSEWMIAALLIVTVLIFSFLTVLYFADRQKAIAFAKRKVVVLRAMLGLDYGGVQLVLPRWRVEGATNPFSIRLFPGWRSYATYPFWIIAAFSGVLLLFVVAHAVVRLDTLDVSGQWAGLTAGLGWVLLLAIAFRTSLFDTHETWLLTALKYAASILRVRLASDFEYVFYRAQLAVEETRRMNVDLALCYDILIQIEDRTFRSHRGISARGIARAARDYIKRGRRSGGSTITQQLVRTLFIVDLQKVWRRKIVEMGLALWIERQIEKDEILQIYLASVRYHDGVFGWLAATHHFFDNAHGAPNKEQRFVAIERIGNIQDRILINRVVKLAHRAAQNGLLESSVDVVPVYEQLRHRGILGHDRDIVKLKEAMQSR